MQGDQQSLLNAQKMIVHIMQHLHKSHWQHQPNEQWNPDRPVIYYDETNFRGQQYLVPVVILRTKPCLWFVKTGCVMCNYQLDADNHDQASSENILNQVEYAIQALGPLSKYPYIMLTSAGSFLSSYEVNDETRIEIARRLRAAGLKCLSFESRAQFCTNLERLLAFKEAFGGHITVGIGLESADDFLRNVCLNKGLTRKTFLQAAETLRAAGFSFYTYVLFGKPFLTAQEDIADTVASIKFALQAGAVMVPLLVVNVQPYTLIHWLWERGQYQVPLLWGPIAVLRKLPEAQRRRVSIKGVDEVAPRPLALPHNCEHCTDRVMAAIKSWNLSRDFQQLEAVWASCSCYTEWEAQSWPPPGDGDYRARISKQYQQIAAELGVLEQK
jgi:radical SAM enzyme (TIGR01210 family)